MLPKHVWHWTLKSHAEHCSKLLCSMGWQVSQHTLTKSVNQLPCKCKVPSWKMSQKISVQKAILSLLYWTALARWYSSAKRTFFCIFVLLCMDSKAPILLKVLWLILQAGLQLERVSPSRMRFITMRTLVLSSRTGQITTNMTDIFILKTVIYLRRSRWKRM